MTTRNAWKGFVFREEPQMLPCNSASKIPLYEAPLNRTWKHALKAWKHFIFLFSFCSIIYYVAFDTGKPQLLWINDNWWMDKYLNKVQSLMPTNLKIWIRSLRQIMIQSPNGHQTHKIKVGTLFQDVADQFRSQFRFNSKFSLEKKY